MIAETWISDLGNLLEVLFKEGMPILTLLIGGWMGHRLGLSRERRLNSEKRRAELPGLLLSAVEECNMLATEGIRYAVLCRYYNQLQLCESETIHDKERFQERHNFFEERQCDVAIKLSRAFAELQQRLAEMRGEYKKDGDVVEKIDMALASVVNYHADGIGVDPDVATSRTKPSLDEWLHSKQLEASEYVRKAFVTKVWDVLKIVGFSGKALALKPAVASGEDKKESGE